MSEAMEQRAGMSMVGCTSGLLTVIGEADKPQSAARSIRGSWLLCRCACGRERVLPRNYINQQSVKSCGQCAEGIALRKKTRRRQKAEKPVHIFGDRLAWDVTCDKCKKVFDKTSDDWAYKDRGKYGKIYWFCSYRCMRAWQRGER